MYKPKLQDIFKWKGKLVEAIGLGDGPFVSLRTIRNHKCPHCQGCLGKQDIDGLIITSPLFQDNVEPVKSIEKTNA